MVHMEVNYPPTPKIKILKKGKGKWTSKGQILDNLPEYHHATSKYMMNFQLIGCLLLLLYMHPATIQDLIIICFSFAVINVASDLIKLRDD